MKLFLIRSLTVFFVVAILFFILDKFAMTGLSKLKDDDYYDLNQLFNNEIDDEILILGSSRAWNHFDIKEIENVTKKTARVVGVSGADFNMQRVLWEQALNNVNETKYLVHVVGSLEFSKRTDGIFKKYKFYPFLDNKYVYDNLSKLQPDLWKDRYIPMYKFHGYYDYFLKGLALNFDNSFGEKYNKFKGYRGFEEIWNGKVNVNSKTITRNDINKGIRFIEDEAKLANEKGKQLILVYTPEHIITNSIINGKKDVIDRLNEVALDFDNVFFLDYSTWIGNNDMDLFSNATHLNSKGAKLFARTFAQDFLNIINEE